MASPVLLIVIYMAFISLGLPDASFGVAWPLFRADIGAPLEAAGLLSVVLTACSALSALSSGWVNKRLGTGPTVAVSCILTAVGLLGYSLAPSFLWVMAAAVPLGLGAGAVDSSLNAHVAANYASRHMNWLHASWGVGATLGPVIMSQTLVAGLSWRSGYRTLATIQAALGVAFVASLGLWRKRGRLAGSAVAAAEAASGTGGARLEGLRRPEPWLQIASYALYAAAEYAVGIWSASLLVESRGMDAARSGLFVSFYYGGIMAGRVLTGFVSDRLGNRVMVKGGLAVALAGLALLAARSPGWLALPALLLVGLGFAPVFPGLMHETPRRFGENTYRQIIGFQMAAACVGGAVLPGLVGLAAAAFGLEVLAPSVMVFVVGLAALVLRLDRTT